MRRFWLGFFLVFSYCAVVGAMTNSDDADVLQELAKSLNVDESWGWTGNDPCGNRWKNVNCDAGTSRVTGIQLANQNLIGTLPKDFNRLTGLVHLGLQKNRLQGALPTFKGMANLQNAYLGNNSFSSIPADFFSGLSSLQFIALDNNPLEPWSIPEDLKESSNLVNFSASNAGIGGRIPDFFGDSMVSLQSLRLSYNNLTGGIPASFKGSALQILWLNNQLGEGLSGSIDVIGSWNQISQLWLQSNAFTGQIPDLSNCTSLRDLQLRDNRLTGPVPDSLVSLPALQNVSLANNALQGPYPAFPTTVNADIDKSNSFCLPVPGRCDSRVDVLLSFAKEVGYPYFLATGWKGNDPCSQYSYITCDAGKNIIVLNIQNQHLNGTISSALANLTYLRTLQLNNNNLSGSIPAELAGLPNLMLLDVRNNNLSGAIPPFNAKRVVVKTAGNSLLGKTPADNSPSDGSSPAQGSTTPPADIGPSAGNGTTNAGGKSSSSVSVGVIAGSVIAIVVVLCIAATVCFLVISYKKRRHRFGRVQSPNAVVINPPHTGNSDRELMKITIASGTPSETHSRTSSGPSEVQVGEAGNMVISIQVLRNVTNNFSERNVLGRGGFGVVYKGELHDGTKIAVKRMEAAVVSSKGLSEFQAEIAVLTKVRHRHLVALLGYCVDGNERLLVYEYMPQGPLSQYLFDWAKNGLSPLDWKQRLTIALDVARGVEYLHSLAQKSFIHRDLKPSNILLGDDMRAKVSDFGLVKLAPEGKYSVETKLAGTFGYLAPEYAVTGRVTTKVDVFSFGVVLMELITGRRALDETQPEESMHLVTWFRRVHTNQETFRRAIDPALGATEETLQSICTVAELAGHCTAREPYQRPDMGHAVNVLSPLVEQWKPTDLDGDDCYGIDLDMTLPQALKKWQAIEGASSTFDGSVRSLDNTQTSIPTKPSGFADSFTSADCR